MMVNIITIGTFDMFHHGHAAFFRRFDAMTKHNAIIGVNTDRFVREYKGVTPATTTAERVALLKTLYPRMKVVEYNGEDVLAWLHSVVPFFSDPDTMNMIVIGSDWAYKDYFIQLGMTQQQFFGAGLSLVYVPYTDSISSTALRKRAR